ncbi:MAG TPA: RNA polymerase sigma factor [Anaeromyxobacter sp.]|nr:RNA polymerase sigma factor [Anaeromyxobacter sp.]
MREEQGEEALMEAYVAGDPGAFQRLFRLLAPSLQAFFARAVGAGPAAEDLLQTTFLKLHGARASYRRGERLRPWVFTIAARVRVDWLRRNGQRGEEDELDGEALADPRPSGDPGEVLLGKELSVRVRAALDRLPEPQRVVVHLHRFEGLGFAEIGRVLGITEGAAKLRAFRAYAQLRTLLSDLVGEEP